MSLKKCLAFILLILAAFTLPAEDDTGSLYGSFRVHFAVKDIEIDAEPVIENNSSRFGIKLNRDITEGLTALGQLELQVTFADGEPKTGGAEDYIAPRYGWLGLSHSDVGSFSFGKLSGVYKDVAGWTDKFRKGGGKTSGFGENSNSTNSRPNSALAYRGRFAGLGMGAQLQFEKNGDPVDSVAGSLSWALESGLALGTMGSWIPDDGSDDIVNIGGGVKFSRNAFYSAITGYYGINDGDYSGNAHDVMGAEFYLTYAVTPWFSPVYGFNMLYPMEDIGAPGDNMTQTHFFGADFFLGSRKNTIVYIQYDLALGNDDSGDGNPDAFYLGFRYDFDLKF